MRNEEEQFVEDSMQARNNPVHMRWPVDPDTTARLERLCKEMDEELRGAEWPTPLTTPVSKCIVRLLTNCSRC